MLKFQPTHYFIDDRDGNKVLVMFVKIKGVESVRTVKVDKNGKQISIVSSRQVFSNGAYSKKVYFTYKDRRISLQECREIEH